MFLKHQNISKISSTDKKIPDTSNLVTCTSFNTKIEKLKIKYQMFADSLLTLLLIRKLEKFKAK